MAFSTSAPRDLRRPGDERRRVGTDDRRAADHGFENGESESFVEGWAGVHTRGRVECAQIGIRDEPREDNVFRNSQFVRETPQLVLSFIHGTRDDQLGLSSMGKKVLERPQQPGMVLSSFVDSGEENVFAIYPVPGEKSSTRT